MKTVRGVAGVWLVCAMCAAAETNGVTWAVVPYAATEAPALKRVESVTFLIRPIDGRVTAMERHTLFDAGTNVLRTGTAELKQAEITTRLETDGETLAKLRKILRALAVP